MIKKLMGIFAMTLMVIGLSACHTIQGVGQDVSSVGHAIEKSTMHHGHQHSH